VFAKVAVGLNAKPFALLAKEALLGFFAHEQSFWLPTLNEACRLVIGRKGLVN
jgi:hypothetical protein